MRWKECVDGSRCMESSLRQDKMMDDMAEHVGIRITGYYHAILYIFTTLYLWIRLCQAHPLQTDPPLS
jgi:hypothetical protein